jgi:hypothetical protein
MLLGLPKMKKTKKQRRRTLPSMGSVSRGNITRIRIPKPRHNMIQIGGAATKR